MFAVAFHQHVINQYVAASLPQMYTRINQTDCPNSNLSSSSSSSSSSVVLWRNVGSSSYKYAVYWGFIGGTGMAEEWYYSILTKAYLTSS